jgi:hypothetical protein
MRCSRGAVARESEGEMEENKVLQVFSDYV